MRGIAGGFTVDDLDDGLMQQCPLDDLVGDSRAQPGSKAGRISLPVPNTTGTTSSATSLTSPASKICPPTYRRQMGGRRDDSQPDTLEMIAGHTYADMGDLTPCCLPTGTELRRPYRQRCRPPESPAQPQHRLMPATVGRDHGDPQPASASRPAAAPTGHPAGPDAVPDAQRERAHGWP
jgi:hypothetical protein